MDGPRRERRHHRKAAPAASSYGDVFGGPPRFAAAPFGAAPPLDYAEVFGGAAAACSIPYLDLPPAAAAPAPAGAAAAGDYREIFGRFGFADFAAPYEDLFGDAPAPAPPPEQLHEEEIASSSGGSSYRSSINNESRLDAEQSTLHQHFKEHESSPIPSLPDSREFVMSYYKTTQAKPDDLVEMTTCTVNPSVDYVVGSSNFSPAPTTNHVSKRDNGIMANGDRGKKSPSTSVTANLRSPESDFTFDQKQHIPERPPLSENVSANESNQKSDSHATSSNGKPFADYAFMRVSTPTVQTQPKVPLPPLGQQPKVLNKKESAAKGDFHFANHSGTPTSVHAPASTKLARAEKRADAALSNTEANPSSAAAAMKEAMEYAEARLRAAKELMERKGDSFKIRKKPSHHRSTRSVEIKAPVEVYAFEENLSVKKPANEQNNSENFVFDKHQQVSAVGSNHHDDSGKMALPLKKPQQMMRTHTMPCQTSSNIEKLGNWRSGDEYFELTGDYQKCQTGTVRGKEDNWERSKPVTEPSEGQKAKTKVTTQGSDLEKYEKLWDVSDASDLGVKEENQKELSTAPMEKGEDRVSTILETSTDNMAHKGVDNTQLEGLLIVENSKGSHDDASFELPCMSEITPEVDFIKDVPNSLSASSSANYATDLGNSSMSEGSVTGTSEEPKNSEGGLEVRYDDEIQCISGSSKTSEEPPEVANVGNSQASQIKSLILEELEGSCVTQASPRVQSKSELEAETYGREKFSFVGESYLHNENEKTIEVPRESLISEVEKVEGEVELRPHARSEESIPDEDVECPEESDITQQTNNPVVSTMLNVFEIASKFIKGDLDQEIQGSLGPVEVKNRTEEGTDRLESDGKGKEAEKPHSENSEETDVEAESAHDTDRLESDCERKEAENSSSENSVKADAEEESTHANLEEPTTSASDTNKGESVVDAQGNITVDEMGSAASSGDEVTIKSANDAPTRLTVNTKDEPTSCPEMSTVLQQLPQNVESAASQTSNANVPGADKTKEACKEAERELATTFEENGRVNRMEGKDSRERISKAEPKHQHSHLEKSDSATSQTSYENVPAVDKTKEVCKEAERELPTERCTTSEEEKSRVNKMEGKDSRERISKAEPKHQHSHLEKTDSVPKHSHLEKSDNVPKPAERPSPVSAEVSRKETPGAQRTKERGSITEKEREKKDKETSRRLEEAKERQKILEKERENAEVSERKKLEEEEREREKEREKDKLAVERATREAQAVERAIREAHERSFNEAREKAEKMALERIAAARQRASAEAKLKEERANAEARIKAERAAVERATAEARERAIKKAKAEKAAAEARERREQIRSSSKDIRQDNQFQRATSSGFMRNTDSSSKVVDSESALRHKARIERHQRTTERVSKALAEKNMRDLMAQREQAEKNRLADFLDPEVKRWSNGKEGNLRALLSTLQYILGADSGWQSVPLTDLITAAAVKKAYRKATLCVHPDKVQQRGATIRQKYICEKVFDLLKDAWNKFTSEER
ncbi:auxilin-like protein 1 isoform X2 [Triticum dicoccoides]|uniref:auxilin-like protein 1 isoform X2 n=1 Tax=Triticum dicoccoides TaxID=85692 RepID=UPI00188F4A0C|nr:auxilin-like protein 1 isoform X2 [Triticum dicoccoides]